MDRRARNRQMLGVRSLAQRGPTCYQEQPMPRPRRIDAPGYPQHVVQRGNNRQRVFFADGDRVATCACCVMTQVSSSAGSTPMC